MASIICTMIKYGFYSTVLALGAGSFFLYHTKPNGLKTRILSGILIDDYVLFKHAQLGNTHYIGVCHRWIECKPDGGLAVVCKE